MIFKFTSFSFPLYLPTLRQRLGIIGDTSIKFVLRLSEVAGVEDQNK